MALTIASLGTPTTWASLGTGKTLSFSAVAAGSVLAVVASAGSAAETFANPTSGWTPGPATNTGDFVTVTYWKIADGSETLFSIDASTSTGNLAGCKVTGFAGTATLEGSNENEANITGAGVTSLNTNAASNTSTDGAAIALFGSDRWDSLETTRAYTNSFTEVVAATSSGSRAGAWIAGKVLGSAGSNDTTFSCADTGDQMYAAILVFGDDVGGGAPSEGSGEVIGVGSLTAEGYAAHSGSGTVGGVGSLAGVGYRASDGSGTVDGVGSLVGVGYHTAEGSGSVDGVGSLVGEGEAPAGGPSEGSGEVIGVGSLTAEGYAAHSGSGTVDGVGSLVGTGYRIAEGSASVDGVGVLVGEGDAPGTATAPVSCVASLTQRSITVTMTRRTASVSFSKRSAVCALEVA